MTPDPSRAAEPAPSPPELAGGADDHVLEGLVTSIDTDGSAHVAPMGPRVDAAMSRLILRPYRTSRTYQNLKRHGEGVFHVTDDAELIASAAVGHAAPRLRPAGNVRGFLLTDACRAYEFRIRSLDDRDERTTIAADVVAVTRYRDFFGFNRARHAVLEAAILATRAHLLPAEEILERFDGLAVLVEKTGAAAEKRALARLRGHVRDVGARAPPRRRVRVRGGSRVHLGLIAPGGGVSRRFGGAGFMLEEPAVIVAAESSPRPVAEGPLARRALEFAARFTGTSEPRCRLIVERAPPAHKGFGSGTQLALAVGRALATLAGESPTAPVLAARLDRGRRSAVGVHGFAHGGFIAEGGKQSEDGIAPLLTRLDVPPQWRILLVVPQGEAGLAGTEERKAFEALERTPANLVDALCRTLFLGILPALAEADFAAFAGALHEYGSRAGACFAPVQHGTFGHPLGARAAALLASEGVEGVAQSSWGPTVLAVIEDEERADALASRVRHALALSEEEVFVTAARNRGADCAERADGPSSQTLVS